MKHAASSTEKGISLPRHVWSYALAAGLLIALLAVLFPWHFLAPTHVFASAQVPTKNTFSTSPSAGPVGAVIAVSISNVSFPDGTQIQLGETTVFSSSCTVVTDSQGGTVQNKSFSGWLRWPTSTGTGTFQVCAKAGTSTISAGFAGFYNVLSATPPQVTVAPTSPDVSKQATVSGTNFLPSGTSVNLLWHAANGGQTLALGTVTSDSSGAFTQTFTVPSRSSTGSYVVTATAGSGQPATLSATTTFHVNGITIVAVPTPVAQASPTLTASPTAPATATVSSTPVSQQTTSKVSGSVPDSSGTILPLVLGGLLLIVVALVVSVLFVRRQRELAIAASGTSGTGGPVWSDAPALGLGATNIVSRITGKTASMRSPLFNKTTAPDMAIIPFDPALAEAMRQAQVSMFATPRPPVDEKVPI
ncbi:MAG: hypothetical protein ABI234_03580 [Ktedonobacteraceae bacterium]